MAKKEKNPLEEYLKLKNEMIRDKVEDIFRTQPDNLREALEEIGFKYCEEDDGEEIEERKAKPLIVWGLDRYPASLQLLSDLTYYHEFENVLRLLIHILKEKSQTCFFLPRRPRPGRGKSHEGQISFPRHLWSGATSPPEIEDFRAHDMASWLFSPQKFCPLFFDTADRGVPAREAVGIRQETPYDRSVCADGGLNGAGQRKCAMRLDQRGIIHPPCSSVAAPRDSVRSNVRGERRPAFRASTSPLR